MVKAKNALDRFLFAPNAKLPYILIIAQPGFGLSKFSLDHFRFSRLAPTVVLLTYEAKQTGSSDAKQIVGHPRAELEAIEDEAAQAMLHADTAAIDRIFSDEWLIIDENAELRTSTKNSTHTRLAKRRLRQGDSMK